MKIFFRSNIDLENEEWPTEKDFTIRPMVGDVVQSKSGLELQVKGIYFEWVNNLLSWPEPAKLLQMRVELHLPEHRYENLVHFHNWYRYLHKRNDREGFRLAEAARLLTKRDV